MVSMRSVILGASNFFAFPSAHCPPQMSSALGTSSAEKEKSSVFLEDLEPSRKTKEPDTTDEKTASETTPSSSQEPKPSNKRQRTLEDMFFGGKKGNEPSKKIKLSTSETEKSSAAKKITVPSFQTTGMQKLNSIPFSMSEFMDSLDDEQKKLLRLECEVMGKSWLKLLKDEITKPYFLSLKRFLWEEGVRGPDDTPKTCRVYPKAKDIYAWSKTPLGKIRVVIIGQDPYHGPGQAQGLCFSVPVGVPVPPSLRNIYAELKAEYPGFQPPNHGNLTAWAANGVLLLNTCLTVRAGDAGSHSQKGWERFTEKVVEVVDKYGGANLANGSDNSTIGGIGRGVVFLAWGAWAAKRVAKLNKTKHLILTSAHPSPLSANRGFLGNGHFRTANDWLERRYGSDGRVDWCKLDPTT